MTITRRTAVKSVLWASLLGAGTRASLAAQMADGRLRVFDSRSAASRAWLAGRPSRIPADPAATAIDVARENTGRWQRLRQADLADGVVGLTCWVDFVQARGVLQHRGLRVRIEGRRGALYQWTTV